MAELLKERLTHAARCTHSLVCEHPHNAPHGILAFSKVALQGSSHGCQEHSCERQKGHVKGRVCETMGREFDCQIIGSEQAVRAFKRRTCWIELSQYADGGHKRGQNVLRGGALQEQSLLHCI